MPQEITASQPDRRAQVGDWAIVVVGTLALGSLVDVAGLPSGYLFASLVVGLSFALLRPGRIELPERGFQIGQAVTGVALGTFLEASTLTELGWRWIPVALVSAATLLITIGAGIVVARATGIDRPTASLGMVAGGASGIVAMADDLGADGRLVAFMQYLRVLVVTLMTPLLVPLLFGASSSVSGIGEGSLLGDPKGWALTIGCGVAGALLGPLIRLPAPALLGPLLLTSALTLAGLTGDAEVPALVRESAFALIGLRIGLQFDRETMRSIRRLMPSVLGAILVLLAACFALGWLLTLTAGVSLLDGYLATTPGGLYAVLPIAYGSGGDTTFVLAVQGLRLFAMIVAAPAVVRRLLRDERRERLSG